MRGITKILLVLSPIAFWYVATPRVAVYFPKDGYGELTYIWNTKDRIDKGKLKPGDATADTGFIFPDDEFFMEFYWHPHAGRRHCISITPKWPRTSIYLDASGSIDMSDRGGTDVDRLKECVWDHAKP
nr:hypothetical protein [Pseudomonas chlororaphis]